MDKLTDKDLDKICKVCTLNFEITSCEHCIIQMLQNMVDELKEVEK